MTTTYQTRELPAASVIADPDQPRKNFTNIADLASSIEQHGLMQPITVRQIGPGRFMVVAGERRFRAMQHLGWDKIPAMVRPVADSEVHELQMLENVARVQMNPIEEATGLQRLLDSGLSAQDIERRLGIGNGDGGEVRWKVKLLLVNENVQALVSRGQFSQTQAIQLSRLSPDGQQRAMRELNEKGLAGNAFTALVETIFKAENQIDMFPETRLSQETLDKAAKFRIALERLAKDAAFLESVNVDQLGDAFAHDALGLQNMVDEAIKTLTKARRGFQRAAGRQIGMEVQS